MSKLSPFKPDFPDFGGRIYLNTAAEGIPLNSCAGAINAYVRAKARGAAGRPELYETAQQCKNALAELMGVDAAEVALLASASDGINCLCNGLDWKPGDEIIIGDLEFPSNVLPWLRLRKAGVQVRVLESRDWRLEPTDFREAVNSRTRLVFISHVSYSSGSKLDISAIGEVVRKAGALFAVDATQSLGRVPVPVENVDYLVASTYKWLLSPHGGAAVYCRKPLLDQLEPGSIGWWSVRDLFRADRFDQYELKGDAARLEPGMPNFPIAYALLDAVGYLNRIGVARIEEQLAPVCDELLQRVSRLPVTLMTPLEPERRAGIVSFLHPDCEAVTAQLQEDGIQVWGGDGRVRISLHLYNDSHDVEALFDKLPALLA